VFTGMGSVNISHMTEENRVHRAKIKFVGILTTHSKVRRCLSGPTRAFQLQQYSLGFWRPIRQLIARNEAFPRLKEPCYQQHGGTGSAPTYRRPTRGPPLPAEEYTALNLPVSRSGERNPPKHRPIAATFHPPFDPIENSILPGALP
jgi:hypothetical protein